MQECVTNRLEVAARFGCDEFITGPVKVLGDAGGCDRNWQPPVGWLAVLLGSPPPLGLPALPGVNAVASCWLLHCCCGRGFRCGLNCWHELVVAGAGWFQASQPQLALGQPAAGCGQE